MSPDLQKYYEESFSMYASKGWTYLIEDLQKIKDNVNNLSLVPDAHDLFFRKGQLDILALILNRKESFDKAYKELQDETDI
jgi:hypothetical protein